MITDCLFDQDFMLSKNCPNTLQICQSPTFNFMDAEVLKFEYSDNVIDHYSEKI